MAYIRFDCGCERDGDEGSVSSAHVSGPQQSQGDRDRKLHHYPADTEPARWCNSCRAERPCRCDTKGSKKRKGKR